MLLGYEESGVEECWWHSPFGLKGTMAMKLGLVMGCVLAVSFSSVAMAGSDYILSASDAAGAAGDMISVDVNLDSSAGSDVQGWSFGLCSDSAALQVDGQTLGVDGAIAEMGGFANLALSADGVTNGIVLDLFGVVSIAPSANIDCLTVDYTILGTADTTVDFCDTLGTPPVATVIVVAGQSITPLQVSGNIDIIDPNQLVASSATGLLGGTVDTTVSFNNVSLGAADAASLSLSYDDSVVTVNSVANTVGADFFEVQPGGAAGELVIGIIMDTAAPLDNQIPASPADTVLATITWDGAGVGTSAISFVDGLGNPAANNGIVFGQDPLYQPSLIDGSVTIVNFNPFIRGDCNDDGIVNIADGINLLNFLFQGGPAPACDDACDSDDDADLAVNDAILIFNYQFSDGAPPAAPFPMADLDPTQGDGLGCNGDADDI